MKNKYFVIHSTDPWLLARLSTDLMMGGYEWRHKSMKWFKDICHPFDEDFKWLEVNTRRFAFHNHECNGTPIRFTLTEKNYIDVLKEILA